MKIARAAAPLLVVLVLGLVSTLRAAEPAKDGAAGNDAKVAKAVEAMQGWLGLIDQGKYGESWDGASEFFRNAVPRPQWMQALEATRKPLGKLGTREIKVKQYQTQMPGAPDGEYVMMQFSTSFENKKEAVETVTAMLDKDGAWRAAGYFIK